MRLKTAAFTLLRVSPILFSGDETDDEKEKEKKHDSGAADLERVTDYAEEKEILSNKGSWNRGKETVLG